MVIKSYADNQIQRNKEKEMTATAPQAVPVSEALAKAKVTAGLLGVHLLPQDIAILSEYKTSSECNKYIMEKKAGQVKVQLTEQQKQYIRDVSSANNSAAYRDKKIAYNNILVTIRQYNDSIDREHSKLFQVARELKKMEAAAPSYDLVPSIEAALSDGWYSLHEVTSKYIILTTGVVHCSHPDINMIVDLGQFKVKFSFASGAVLVQPFKDNADYEGYIHPHIGIDGTVCWGNANNIYKRARETLDIELLFRTLRTLLGVYSPDSPYVTLHELDYQKNKDKYLAMNKVFRSAKAIGRRSHCIETREAITEDYIECREDDNGEEVYVYEAYYKVYENTPITVSDSVFVRDGSLFVEVYDYEWR